MRAFVTGATGFIGGYLARALLARGDDVVALVRSPEKAAPLEQAGARLVRGDVTETAGLMEAMRGSDAVFHLAAWYQIGIDDRAAMEAVNVHGTQNVLDAAHAAGASRIVYCSTLAALGMRDQGHVAHEATPRPPRYGSAYEETKTRAHQIAHDRAAGGAPIVTVMPGAVYGPGDESVIGLVLRLYAKKLLVVCPFLGTEFSWVPVEDLCDGIIAACEKGRAGEDYALGGENASIRQVFATLYPITGIRPPRTELPAALMRVSRPLSPLLGRLLKTGPNIVAEGMTSMGGSWMASSAKAERELGYTYRSIADAMPQTIEWFKEH